MGITKRSLTMTRSLLLFLSVISNAGAFLPDRVTFQENIPESDYTLKELTEEAVVQVVAKFFEASDPDRYNPGDLSTLDPLTPSSLFGQHFGDCVSSDRFKAALQEIVEGNLAVDRRYHRVSEWHFNAEQITEGNRRMISLRNTILTSLNADQPDYSGVRENIGKYLHLLQSFYSNTNWVELNPHQVNTQLGIEQLSDPIAEEDQDTCRNCNGIPIRRSPELLKCDKVPNYNQFSRVLFSGYHDSRGIPKPESDDRSWGKCSHGGRYDSSFIRVATGGINKETSDPSLSPHFHLHEAAASVALRASEAFFNDAGNGIVGIIGEAKFKQLLNLNSGNALVLVIDDTGSMSDEIDAVINTAVELVRRFTGTCFASAQFIVSPFNDPEVGPLTDTADPEECIAALNALYAHGGGDCPELCMTGIEVALQRVIYASDVYIWTDADDKDSDKLPDVLALAQQKGAKLNFFTTGECARRRRKRGVSGSYDLLTEATGGTIYQADDTDISSVSDIIIADTLASEVSVLRWSANDVTEVTLEIPVDNTMEGLSVTVSGPTPREEATLFDPSGAEVTFSSGSIEVIVDAANVFTFILTINNYTGIWSLRLNFITHGEMFEVGVSARSFLDFSYQIFERDSTGFLVPIDGLPLAGANVTFVVDVISPEIISSIDAILLYDIEGRYSLVNSSLVSVGGRSTGIFVSDVTLPLQSFTIGIIGTDSGGQIVRRVRPAVVQVLGFSLALASNDNTLGDLVPGGSATFGIVLGNLGASDTFDISFSVTKRSSALTNPVRGNVAPSMVNLAETSQATGQVTLQADAAAAAGDSVLVTVTMTSRTSSERNFVSQSITISQPIEIIEVPEDSGSPSCSVEERTGNCSIDMINNNCASHTWSIRVALQDDRAIAEILVSDSEISGSQYRLNRSDASNINLIYESNCCCPNVTVAATDTVGNTARCGVDYFTPVINEVVNVLQCVRDCDDSTMCQNGGLCIGGKCDCAPGFNGTLCEYDIDNCVSHKCMHGSRCIDQVQGYFCNCTNTGYHGDYCEIDIDDCASGPCANGGICVDELKYFHCNCTGTGFQGDYCEQDINECSFDVCLNEGFCVNLNGSYNCDCPPGWKGMNCEINRNECIEDNPCENNSTCEDTDGSYGCVCLIGYNGTHCQTNIDECASNPCQHSGVCVDMVDQYICACEGTGYEGIHCDKDVNECENAILNNCHADALCTNEVGSFVCSCLQGFEGDGTTCLQCTPGNYGVQCTGICTCVDGGSCHHVYGGCSCDQSFEDQECDKAKLKVKIQIGQTSEEIVDGSNVRLICQVNLPAEDLNNVMWILPDNSTRVITNVGQDEGQYELYLPNVDPVNHSGEYTCVAETVLQTSERLEVTTNVQIDVKAPGRIINAPRQESVELEGIVEFNCTVFGNTAPSINWCGLNGERLEDIDNDIEIVESSSSSLFKTSSLRIVNIARADNGTYICNVTNTVNIRDNEQHHDFGEYHLFVLERPEIALERVQAISNSEILVVWSLVYSGNLEIANCSLGYWKITDSGRMTKDTANSTTFYIIPGLDAYNEYIVDVRCRNKVGTSETVQHEGLPVRTKQSEPGQPTDVRLTQVTQSSFVVHWNVPDVTNGPIAFYLVEVESEYNRSILIQTSSKQIFVRIDNLEPATNYTVTIRAVNVEDEVEYLGDRAEGISFTTLQAPPSAPTNIEITDERETCKISWNKPENPNGVIENYTIYRSVKGRDGYTEQTKDGLQIVPGNTYEFTYKEENLIAYSVYSFYVTANTSVGEGLPSKTVICKTESGAPKDRVQAPLPVPDDTPKRVTSSTFKMMVTPASTRNGPIGCYEIVVIPLEDGASLPTGNPDEEYPPNSITDYAASGARPGFPYSAVVIKGSELSKPAEIIIGDKSLTTCNDHESFSSRRKRKAANGMRKAENGPLVSGTTYTTFTRAFVPVGDGSKVEYSSSLYMDPVSTKASKDNNVAWIVVGVIVVILVIVVLVLVLIYRHWKGKKEEESSLHLTEKEGDVELSGINNATATKRSDLQTEAIQSGSATDQLCTENLAEKPEKSSPPTSPTKVEVNTEPSESKSGQIEKDVNLPHTPAKTEGEPESHCNDTSAVEIDKDNNCQTDPNKSGGDYAKLDIEYKATDLENGSPKGAGQNDDDKDLLGSDSTI